MRGFYVQGEHILYANRAKGIFKPRQMSAALSIKTTVPRVGRLSWYNDQGIFVENLDQETGLLRYDLARGDDPTNKALLLAMQRNAPLIYFVGHSPGYYQAVFPVWVCTYNQEYGHVLLATSVSDSDYLQQPGTIREKVERSYSTATVRVRNHQAWFSIRTKAAYLWRCAFSGLPVRDLLVGAHIVPDKEGGPASIKNGICMSALHHVAFDTYLIGIDPEYRVHVSPRLSEQKDGQLLANLKGLNGTPLRLPMREDDWPGKDFLDYRFKQYQERSM